MSIFVISHQNHNLTIHLFPLLEQSVSSSLLNKTADHYLHRLWLHRRQHPPWSCSTSPNRNPFFSITSARPSPPTFWFLFFSDLCLRPSVHLTSIVLTFSPFKFDYVVVSTVVETSKIIYRSWVREWTRSHMGEIETEETTNTTSESDLGGRRWDVVIERSVVVQKRRREMQRFFFFKEEMQRN